MSEPRGDAMRTLATGVPGLDEVLGGGIPEYSFNLIAGPPGTGKTTLAHQVVFASATPERPALYFTVMGEPPFKMLRYQRRMAFFDPAKVGSAVRFVNLGQEVLEGGLAKVLDTMVAQVEAAGPALVVVDSFRTVLRGSGGEGVSSEGEVQGFVQRLGLYLTSWQATTFLVGEYTEGEVHDNPVFTVADGVLWLLEQVDRNSSVRKVKAMKVRGQARMPGLHVFRITEAGIQVFPRLARPAASPDAPRRSPERLSMGVPGLDEMLGGGIPLGDSVVVAGPAGSGKTVFSTQFIAEGVRRGDAGVIAVFEERPRDYIERSRAFGLDLDAMVRQGKLEIMYLRPLDLSVDEALLAIRGAVDRLKARRVVIDSLSGFELAVAATFREDFRESLYRLILALTDIGVTVMMPIETTESFTDLRLTPHGISFLTDDILLQRYVELGGQLRRVLAVVKMRASAHSHDLRLYDLTARGAAMGEVLRDYRGILTGVPEPRPNHRPGRARPDRPGRRRAGTAVKGK
jgi:circadian clock protein KaiC